MSKTVRIMNTSARSKSRKSAIRGSQQASLILAPRKPTVKSLDKRVKAINKKEEVKHKDFLFASDYMASGPGAGQMLLLNGLVQGDTNLTREGNKVYITSIQIKAVIITNVLLTSATEYRIIVFRDNFPNGVAPTAGSLLDINIITAYLYAPYNAKYQTRYKILYDKRGVSNPSVHLVEGAGPTVTSVIQKKISIQLKRKLGFIANYGLGNAGTIADITHGAIYILLLSNRTIGDADGPTFLGGSRVNFKDN